MIKELGLAFFPRSILSYELGSSIGVLLLDPSSYPFFPIPPHILSWVFRLLIYGVTDYKLSFNKPTFE